MQQKKITMKDIAEASGVSPATVCRVLNDRGYPVRQEVREKVINAARELGYISFAGSGLMKEVAVIVPDTGNLFYSSLFAGIQSVLSQEKYMVMLVAAAEKNEAVIQHLIQKNISGMIVVSAGLYPFFQNQRPLLQEKKIPVVFADCSIPIQDYSNIFYNYEKGARIGTDYLLDCGCRRLCYAGMQQDRESRRQLVNGFRKAAEKRADGNLSWEILTYEEEIVRDDQQVDVGARLGEQILALSERPDGVFAMNDMIAFGLLRCFRRHGVSVPEEISVLGFDDNPFCETVFPALTTVKVQPEQMGRMAARLLLEECSGLSREPVQLSIEPGMVERDSVKKAGHFSEE